MDQRKREMIWKIAKLFETFIWHIEMMQILLMKHLLMALFKDGFPSLTLLAAGGSIVARTFFKAFVDPLNHF